MSKIVVVAQSLVYRRQCRHRNFRNLKALAANNDVVEVMSQEEIMQLGLEAFRAGNPW